MGMRFPTVERRREPRFTVESAANVVTGPGRTQAGTVVDVSDHGLGLSFAKAPGRNGETVKVCVEKAVITGRLKYCRQMGSEFAAGVQLTRRLSRAQVQALLAQFVARI